MILAIFNTFVPAVALALVVWIGLRVLHVNAATRYWTWWGVLAAVIAMPLWPEQEIAAVALPIDMPELVPAAPVVVEPGTNWLLWMVLAWAAFAGYRLVRIAISFVHVWRLKARAEVADFEELRQAARVERPVRLLVSDEAGSPMAVGFVRPAVIVPASLMERLSEDERDYVLLHELAHMARYDDWANLAARIVGAFVGLHPVAAFALSRIAKERELACDDWVVAATGEVKQYAASLARVFELSRGGKELLATGITGSQLGDRVEQLLAQGRRFTKGASVVTVSVMAVALAGMTAVGSQSPMLVAFAQQAPRPVVREAQAPVAPAAPATPAAPRAPRPVQRADAEQESARFRTDGFLLSELNKVQARLLEYTLALQKKEQEMAEQREKIARARAEMRQLEEQLAQATRQLNTDEQIKMLREQLEVLQRQREQQF